MIKIAYVINYIVRNGPSRVILNLISNMDKTKYDISLITLFKGNDEEIVKFIQSQGITVFECKTLNRLGCILFQSQEFTRLLKQEEFDIIHTHGLIPDVLSSRVAGSMKKISTIHNNMFEDYYDSYGAFKSRAYIEIHLCALKKLDMCVCCSKSVYEVMKKYLDNTCYIRNGIEPTQINSVITRKELNIPNSARVFLYAGVLSVRKNVAWLIKEFVKYHRSDEYLLVLGQGEKEMECKSVADSHVRILGFKTDIKSYMSICDIYISASSSEGFSISVLEALSCGLGLMVSDIPSHKEVVNMETETYLGEVFNKNDFKMKLELIRTKYFDKNKIRQFQVKQLSAKSMAEDYESVYVEFFLRRR